MLLFALAAAFLTSIVSGSVSALYSRDDLSGGLKDGAMHTTTGRRRALARDVLVVCQVAFSFLLLIGAGLMLRSFSKLRNVDPGFVPQRVLAMSVDFNWSKYLIKPEQRRQVSESVLHKIQLQPGVLYAAYSSGYPLDADNGMGWTNKLTIEGHIVPEGERLPVDLDRPIFANVTRPRIVSIKTPPMIPNGAMK